MKNLSENQLIALATSTALKFAHDSDGDELLILADFFSLIGSTLILIYDRRNIDSSSSNNNTNNSDVKKTF